MLFFIKSWEWLQFKEDVMKSVVYKAKMRCRLCGSSKLACFLSLKNSPKDVSRLLRKDEIKKDKPVTVNVFNCKDCGFVQLTKMVQSDFYDDYLMATTHSPQMQAFQINQASNFINKFSLKGKRIIEIGCGDGNYLECLTRLGVLASGIEPSDRFRKIAISKGLEVFPGYVISESPLPNAPYDGFVTRQTLEHVPDPNDFLRAIRLSIMEGGVGLIEVPSFEQSLEQGRFYDFFPDHPNYFSFLSLAYLLKRNDFIIIEMKRSMNDEYIEATVKVGPPLSITGLQKAADNLSKDIYKFVTRTHNEGKKIAMWGAGAKGITLLAVAGIPHVEYVIDSAEYKQGMFTRVSNLRVVSPEHIYHEPVDIVIITAMAYRDEIIDQLRNNLKFKGTIAYLGHRLEILGEGADGSK